MALPWLELWCAPRDDSPSGQRPRRESGAPARGPIDMAATDDALGSERLSLSPTPRRLRLADDLATRLRRRDEDAFTELVHSAGASLVTFAASIVGSRDIAEDVVQEVLIRVWRLGGTLAEMDGRSLADYLFRAVRNGALTAVRGDARAARTQAAAARAYATDSAHLHASEEEDATTREIALVRSALSQLTPHQRAAIALRYGEGMPLARIAQILQISEKGAEQLLVRIRKLLRERVLRAGHPVE